MNFPLSTSDLEKYIPHRPPMVWVESVIAVEADGGRVSLKLRPDALYMNAEGLRVASGIEFLAQAFGFVGIARHLISPAKEASRIEKAFLVAIRDAEFLMNDGDLKAGTDLVITLSGRKEVGPVQITDGVIATAAGAVVMKANLKVYAETK